MFTVHLFKKALAGQFRFAPALANPRACMCSEQHGDFPTLLNPTFCGCLHRTTRIAIQYYRRRTSGLTMDGEGIGLPDRWRERCIAWAQSNLYDSELARGACLQMRWVCSHWSQTNSRVPAGR